MLIFSIIFTFDSFDSILTWDCVMDTPAPIHKADWLMNMSLDAKPNHLACHNLF